MEITEAVAIVSVVAIIAGTLSSIVRSVFARGGGRNPRVDLAGVEARLARIEQAVEATAVEVERISEGQRFTTKLLADRATERVAPFATARAGVTSDSRGGGQ